MDNQSRKKKYANNSNNKKSSNRLYPVQYFPRNSGLIGLQNLGNTCYMNSALQALSNCPQLTSYMLENFDHIKPGLAKNFALLLYEIWVHGHFMDYSHQNNTKVFYDYLTPTSILYGIKKACPNFRSSATQEDAQEFLKFFLDRVHEELKTPVNPSSSQSLDQPSIECDCATISTTENVTSSKSNLNSPKRDDDLINLETASFDDEKELNQHSNDQRCNDSNQPKLSELDPNRLSNSINIPFDCSKANHDHSPSRALSSSLNNYLLNENNQTSKITPGQGDVNYQYVNGFKRTDDDEFKENDLNKPNSDLLFETLLPINQLPTDAVKQFEAYLNDDSRPNNKDVDNNSGDNCLGLTGDDLNDNSGDNRLGLMAEDLNEDAFKQFEAYLNGDSRSNNEDVDNNSGDNCLGLTGDDLNDNSGDNRLGLTADDLNEDVSNKSTNNASNDKEEEIVYQSIISRMFNGEILNSVQCLTCNNVSTIKETFQDLSLPIPNKEDLRQTRQVNLYLTGLEKGNYSSSIINRKRTKERNASEGKKKTKTKNGLTYRRLTKEDDELSEVEEDQFKLSSSSTSRNSPSTAITKSGSLKLGRRLVSLPLVRHLGILFLYINYFFKAYVLYFLLSVFYWSHVNLWGPTITLNDCLDAFFSTDELKDSNMYSCEKCKKLSNGIKYTNLVRSPDLLCIHFKRFRNELMFPAKISTYVSFPLKGLRITSHMFERPPDDLNDGRRSSNIYLNHDSTRSSSANCRLPFGAQTVNGNEERSLNESNDSHLKLKRKTELYDLVSVICHRGHYNSGHYITYALNCLDECWYEYDDKSVRKVDENKVSNCEAYVVFYKKRADLPILTDETDDDDEEYESGDERSLLSNRSKDAISSEKLSFFFRNYKNTSKPDRPSAGHQRSELFRKRRYDKINGEFELNQTTDLLGDIKL